MIPYDYITEWRARAPWVQDAQVEQDLIIARAIVEVFGQLDLRHSLAFRGGSALYKLHLPPVAVLRRHRLGADRASANRPHVGCPAQ